MRGTKTSILRLTSLTLLAAAAMAADPDYFPLQPGNSWTYRVTQGRTAQTQATVNVGDLVTVNQKDYYNVQFFGKDLLVRQDADGSLLAYDKETGAEGLWLPIGSAVGSTAQTTFDTCAKNVRVESRNAKITTEIGTFDNALELRYTANCADAGAVVQYFIPYVGLIAWETTSIAGPVRYEATYTRTGFTNVDVRSNAFTLSLDNAVYPVGSETEGSARVTVRQSSPRTFVFPSSQSTDMRITNEAGETVYFWSADKLFAQIYREEKIGPGERSWQMSFPTARLPRGRYTAEAWLTTSPREGSATVTFEVR